MMERVGVQSQMMEKVDHTLSSKQEAMDSTKKIKQVAVTLRPVRKAEPLWPDQHIEPQGLQANTLEYVLWFRYVSLTFPF